MNKIVYWIVCCVVCINVFACAPNDPEKRYQLRYQFLDQTQYRVDAKYTFTDTLEKSHQGKPFLEKQDIVHVSAAFNLKIEQTPKKIIHAHYFLSNISVHDQAGNFRLELSPLNGEITWFGETQGFEDYFDEQEFENYRQLLSRPLAVVTVDALGVQQSQTHDRKSDLSFNYELIKLLGKNRAIGKIVVKTLKIPPVLMTIFSNEAVWVGKQWMYQGGTTPQIASWDHPLTTVIKLKSLKEKGLFVVFDSEMEFTGDELTELGKQMGVTELQQVSFEESRFRVGGEVYFNPQQGRPNEGSMLIEKKYGLKNGEEDWRMLEEQKYWFSVNQESK